MKINVNGMSIEDILNISQADISRLSRADLAKVTSRLASAANKRIKRAVGTEYEKTVMDRAGGSNFSVKGKNQGQLQGEFARARNFLNKKTSSIKGATEVFSKAMNRIGATTQEQASELWHIYNRFKELRPDLFQDKGWGSDRIQQMIRVEMIQSRMAGVDLPPEILFDRVLEAMNMQLTKEAEEYAEEKKQYDDWPGDGSTPFDIGGGQV